MSQNDSQSHSEAQISDNQVAAVRAFNRFYTRKLGVLDQHLMQSPYSLSEARVLYELAHRQEPSAKEIGTELGLDAGYLSRIVQNFDENGLITRTPLASDRRQYQLALTAKGRQASANLERSSQDEVGAMTEIERLLGESAGSSPPAILRSHRPGDMGWVVQRNGALYAEEFGWDASYEALVARIVADYVEKRDPEAEAAWIAEVDGVPAGCVFCVREDAATARLRLLLVEPWARGLGIGGRLVDEVLRFARRAGYSRITLWTNDVLADARRIYQRAGFTLDDESPHHSFGKNLMGQNWSRDL